MYKNGLAGITKATVSITFDNSNKKQSPLGFETHDEITITRQVFSLRSGSGPLSLTDNSTLQRVSYTACDVLVCVVQVVIGGRNKYLINGVNANNLRVQDLFCSVGLNVNNPHFLIMQVTTIIH